MLSVKKLTLENVGRFVGRHELDISKLQPLAQVDGRNLNTGGSSGSGKSTLFLALEYVLGLNDVPASTLQSRLTKEGLSVSVDLVVNGSSVTVTRGKSGLKITQDGVTVSGSVKVAEEKLAAILQVSGDLLRPMIHKRQGEAGMVMSMTPKQYYEFLSTMLNLSDHTGKAEKADKKITELETKLLAIQNSLDVLDGQRETAVTAMMGLKQPETISVTDQDVKALAVARDGATAHLGLIKEELRSKLNLLKRPAPLQAEPFDRSHYSGLKSSVLKQIAEVESADAAAKKAIESKILALRGVIASGQVAASKLEDLKARLASDRQAMESLADSNCPTCRRDWPEAKETMAAKLAGQIASSISAIEKAQHDIAMAERGAPILKALEVESKSAPAELAELKKKADSIEWEESQAMVAHAEMQKERGRHYAEQVAAYEAEHLKTSSAYLDMISSAESIASAAETRYRDASNALSVYSALKKSYEESLAKSSHQIDQILRKISEVLENKIAIEKELLVARESARCLKGYVNQLFKSSLDQVASRATEILRAVPNTSTVAVSFDTIKETKSGVVREEVTAIVSMDGDVGVPIKSLSGGERAAVDLAVDLAAIEMIESYSGKGVDLFVLDEPFDGLDSICKENCLEILKNYGASKVNARKILIVDHSNETKEMIQDRVTVERDGLESRILQ